MTARMFAGVGEPTAYVPAVWVRGSLGPTAMAELLEEDGGVERAPAELSGTVLGGRYALGRVLGAGGMGAVFEAKDLRLGRSVAIKVMRPSFAVQAGYIKRFLREAQTASQIRHRNVVVVLDYGEAEGGLVYSVMELLVGRDLEVILQGLPQRRIAWEEARGLLVQIVAGLRAAHAQGVIHRDIKPANCFVMVEDDEPVVKLVDFGIAKLDDAVQTQRLTGTGDVLGTPSYIAPELVLTTNPASPLSDVYSLGVLAYRMLTGALPFSGKTSFEVMHRACIESVPPMREHGLELPNGVEALVLEMLAKRPEGRPDMGVLRRRLLALAREPVAEVLEIPVSSPLQIDVEASKTARVAAQTVTLSRAAAPEPVLEPTEPLADASARPSRSIEAPPAAIVGPSAGVPERPIDDPIFMPSTLRLVSETTPLEGAASRGATRRRMVWLVIGVLAAVAAVVVVVWSKADSPTERNSPAAASTVAIAEPEAASAALDASKAERSIALPMEPEHTERAPTPVGEGSSKGGDGPATVEPAATVEPPAPETDPAAVGAPEDTQTKPRSTKTTAKQPAGPPSDAIITKRLERKIEANCKMHMAGERVTVSFFVDEDGAIASLTAIPKNAAGKCAIEQVKGTKLRPRNGDAPPIDIVVE